MAEPSPTNFPTPPPPRNPPSPTPSYLADLKSINFSVMEPSLARNVKTKEGVAIKVIDKDKILKRGLVSHIKREVRESKETSVKKRKRFKI